MANLYDSQGNKVNFKMAVQLAHPLEHLLFPKGESNDNRPNTSRILTDTRTLWVPTFLDSLQEDVDTAIKVLCLPLRRMLHDENVRELSQHLRVVVYTEGLQKILRLEGSVTFQSSTQKFVYRLEDTNFANMLDWDGEEEDFSLETPPKVGAWLLSGGEPLGQWLDSEEPRVKRERPSKHVRWMDIDPEQRDPEHIKYIDSFGG